MKSRRLPLLFTILVGMWIPSAAAQGQFSSANDRARLLAALPLANTSPLKKFDQLAAYQETAGLLNTKWQEVRKKRWDAMVTWAGTEIRPHINAKLPLFYMFGGPDFLNVNLLYPEATRYILCGLETIGKVPEMESWNDEKVAEALTSISAILQPVLDQGFFITSEMGTKLLKSDAYGVLPILYVFMARTGNTIIDVHYVGLDQTGSAYVVPGDEPIKAGAKGIRITFMRDKQAAPQELYYFRTDLSDKAITADKRFLLFLARCGQANTFLKAAQCLLHTKEFSVIRDLLLTQSATILQDDSGIPYHAFQGMQWKIALYGNYLGPIQSIAWADQPELRRMYAVPGAAKPLSFKSGYGSKERANLQFATRDSK